MDVNNMNENLLKGQVKIDELSKFISKSGVIVKPHIGRIRKRITIPKELMGKVKRTEVEEDEKFSSEYITQGTFSVIPKSDEAALNSIETSIRSKVKQLAIACDGTFMTSEVYLNEYLPYFQEKKVLYFDKMQEITMKWDTLIDVFKVKLDEYLTRRNIPNKDHVLKTVYASIPTKKEFINSFYVDISLTAFPTEENVDMFSTAVADEVKKSIQSQKVGIVVEMLGTLFSESFDKLNYFINFYKEKGTIKQQQLNPLKDLKAKLVSNNIFAHEWINEIIDGLTVVEKMPFSTELETDSIVEEVENILIKVYGRSIDLEISNYLNLDNPAIEELQMAEIYYAMNPSSVAIKKILDSSLSA